MGGATPGYLGSWHHVKGLSPRGRGNHREMPFVRGEIGSIPAWAGQPECLSIASPSFKVISPRGRGNPRFLRRRDSACGLSPRGRGNRLVGEAGLGRGGSIPAWAGQPRRGERMPITLAVYPRVGGATRATRRTGLTGKRSIPAWAGQPRMDHALNRWPSVYPRVGGATQNRHNAKVTHTGLSPRGRGNPAQAAAPSASEGSIPAWAGQPLPRPARIRGPTVYPRVGGAT